MNKMKKKIMQFVLRKEMRLQQSTQLIVGCRYCASPLLFVVFSFTIDFSASFAIRSTNNAAVAAVIFVFELDLRCISSAGMLAIDRAIKRQACNKTNITTRVDSITKTR